MRLFEPQPLHGGVPSCIRRNAVTGARGVADAPGRPRRYGTWAPDFARTTPLEMMNTRPEWNPLTPLHADVIRKSTVPSLSMSPSATASNPNASPGVRHV